MKNDFKNLGEVLASVLADEWRAKKTRRGFDATPSEFTEERRDGHKAVHKQTTLHTCNVIPFPVFTGQHTQHCAARSSTGCGEIGAGNAAYAATVPNARNTHGAGVGIDGERVNAIARTVSNRSPDVAGYPPAGIEFDGIASHGAGSALPTVFQSSASAAETLTRHKPRSITRGRFYKRPDGILTNSIRTLPALSSVGSGSGPSLGGTRETGGPEPCAAPQGELDSGAIRIE